MPATTWKIRRTSRSRRPRARTTAPTSRRAPSPRRRTCARTPAAWATIPHADSCGDWDGGYPAPVQGQCTAVAASGQAAMYAGDAGAGTIILPDGRRITPAGSDWVFDEDDLEGGLTTYLGPVAGTSLVVTVDDGPVDHAVRAIDSTKVGSGTTPVTGYVPFHDPATLNAAAAFVAPGTALRRHRRRRRAGALARHDDRRADARRTRSPSCFPREWTRAAIRRAGTSQASPRRPTARSSSSRGSSARRCSSTTWTRRRRRSSSSSDRPTSATARRSRSLRPERPDGPLRLRLDVGGQPGAAGRREHAERARP